MRRDNNQWSSYFYADKGNLKRIQNSISKQIKDIHTYSCAKYRHWFVIKEENVDEYPENKSFVFLIIMSFFNKFSIINIIRCVLPVLWTLQKYHYHYFFFDCRIWYYHNLHHTKHFLHWDLFDDFKWQLDRSLDFKNNFSRLDYYWTILLWIIGRDRNKIWYKLDSRRS